MIIISHGSLHGLFFMKKIFNKRKRIRTHRYALLSSLFLCAEAHASENQPTTYLKASARLQLEALSVLGSYAKLENNQGFQLADTWASGAKKLQDWGGFYLDGGHALTSNIKIIGRYSFRWDIYQEPHADLVYKEKFIGVQSPLGTVKVGRLATPYKSVTAAWDPLNETSFQARGNGGLSGGALGHSSYLDHAMDYRVQLKNFQLTSFYARYPYEKGQPGNGSLYAVSLDYRFTPQLQLVAAMLRAPNQTNKDTLAQKQRRAGKLGIRYQGKQWHWAAIHEYRGQGLEHGQYSFVTASFHQQQNRYQTSQYSVSVGRFEPTQSRQELRQLGHEFISLGYAKQVRKNMVYHIGIRHSSYGLQGSEQLVGAGFKWSMERQLFSGR